MNKTLKKKTKKKQKTNIMGWERLWWEFNEKENIKIWWNKKKNLNEK